MTYNNYKIIKDHLGSEIRVKEMQDNKDNYKKAILQMMYELCSEEIKVSLSVLRRAEEIRNHCNIKYKDSYEFQSVVIGGVILMIATKLDIVNDVQIQKKGVAALKDTLGVTGTIRFLEQFDHGGSGDYTAEKYLQEEAEPTDEEIRKMFGY